MTQLFIPAWIVETLGADRCRAIVIEAARDMKRARIPLDARSAAGVLSLLAAEADAAQHAIAGARS
jgi:hypothetical protein